MSHYSLIYSLSQTLPFLALVGLGPAVTQTSFAADSAGVEMKAAQGAQLGEVSSTVKSVGQRMDDLEQRLRTMEQKTKPTTAQYEESAPLLSSPQRPSEILPPKKAAIPQAKSNSLPPAVSLGAPARKTNSASNAFNPNISLILSGIYSNLSQDPQHYQVTGFHLPDETLKDISPQRGFGLGESELGIYAAIDPMFAGTLNLAIDADDGVATEEAHIQTTSLSHGLRVKAGRFYSGIGYLNQRHAHTWDFADAPLIYQVLFGGQFRNDGLQLHWLAPTDTLLEFGAEVGRGDQYPGTDRNKNGIGASALYVHWGGDLGESNSWRTGISWLHTSAVDLKWSDTDLYQSNIQNSFTGSSKIWIVDGVWKWSPNGNPYFYNFKLQGEILRRKADGTVNYDINSASRGIASGAYSAAQSGWYLQAIYQFMPSWRVGVRRDQLASGSVDYGANNSNLLRPDDRPARNSLMFDFNPSEFSRIRLQFANDQSRVGVTDRQIFLQYQMSLGAHGAHIF